MNGRLASTPRHWWPHPYLVRHTTQTQTHTQEYLYVLLVILEASQSSVHTVGYRVSLLPFGQSGTPLFPLH